MKQSSKVLVLSTAALMAAFAFAARAQEGGGSAPAAGGEAAEAPAEPVKPHAAEIMPMTSKNLLLDVARAGEGYVAVGDRGGIIVSADGKSWTQVPVPVRAALTAVYFADAQHGWAVGHDATIIATSDGGKSWKLQSFKPELEKPLLDVLFLDAQHGLACGAYGLLLATEDGGATWTDVDAPAIRGDEVHFNALVKLNDGSLFIAGEAGMLALSSDQGKTWSKLKGPYDSSLFGALPLGDKGAVIFGLRGNVYMTQEVGAKKGATWTKLDTHSVASMFGGATLPSGELAMVGLNGVILIAGVDGSVHTLQTPSGTPLSAAVPSASGLLAVGESGVQIINTLK